MTALACGVDDQDAYRRVGAVGDDIDAALSPLDRRGDGLRDIADVILVPTGQQSGDLGVYEFAAGTVAMLDTADADAAGVSCLGSRFRRPAW
ncbi:hypothetical protein ACW9HJ_07985 [Nocardia gipuzkoensis]